MATKKTSATRNAATAASAPEPRKREAAAVAEERPRTRRRRSEPVDELDLGILAQLQEDGRRPFQQIARELGVTEGAIRQRVTRMKDAGILHINAFVDPNALGLRLVATVLLRTQGSVVEVADRLAECPEIEYIVITGGSFDLMAEIVCENTAELLDVVNTHVRSQPGVVSVDMLMHLDQHKQEFEWGRRVWRPEDKSDA